MAQDSETYIKTAFDHILANYRHATFNPFAREQGLWRVFEELAAHFQNHVSRPTLKVKWSVGKGNWARVPWIALLDSRETHSTQNGVYPVYLFRQDLSGVYLALNQGAANAKEQHGTPGSRRILRAHADRLLRDLPALQPLKEIGFVMDQGIDLHTDRGPARDYKASVVAYKLYRKEAIPADVELLNDLELVLQAYDQYLEQQPFREQEAPLAGIIPGPPLPDFRIATAIHEVISYIADRGFIYEPW